MLSLYFYIFYCGCQASSKGFMEENGHLYRIYRLQAFMDFYIELGGCQKISLERFDFYIGMQIGICQYIVEKRIIYFLLSDIYCQGMNLYCQAHSI